MPELLYWYEHNTCLGFEFCVQAPHFRRLPSLGLEQHVLFNEGLLLPGHAAHRNDDALYQITGASTKNNNEV